MRLLNFLLLYHATLAQDGFKLSDAAKRYVRCLDVLLVDPEDVQALNSKDEDCPVLQGPQ